VDASVATPAIARVLIDSPLPQLDKLFDYRIPPSLAEQAAAGVRVRVPLRSAGRIVDGFIVETAATADEGTVLSDLEEVVSPVRILAPEVWRLARSVADRAAGSAADVIRLAIPKRQVRVEKTWLAARAAPGSAVAPAPLDGYEEALGSAIAGGRRLALDAVPRLVRSRDGAWLGHWALTMAAAATRCLAAGLSAILAVPDYRDQEQLLAALAAALPGDRIARLDARQSNPERYAALLSCLGETPMAIVGNRSVVYAPARRLGLIALWDDGDPLYREPLSPYAHARDAALIRQEQQGCSLVLLGHARSTEAQRLVELGWLEEAGPARRTAPRVVLTATQTGEGPAAQARIPSSALREARRALSLGPILVQVARPGYSPGLSCAACDEPARCVNCAGPLGLKGRGTAPSCLWCGAIAAPWRCPHCGSQRYRMLGSGSQRTAEELGRAFPGTRVIASDGERPLLRVASGPALVIATRGAEPIADGGYRAVLLLDGERMMTRESLRVAEDCLRWWANAAALAAPGAPVLLAGVSGPAATALATWRLAGFAAAELADRRRLRFPPAVRVATVSGDPDSVERAVAPLGVLGRTDVLGPVELEPGRVRSIVRFDYAEGAEVAGALRSQLIRSATGGPRRPGGGRAAPRLRVRFDDPEPFS